jgi:addiction module HigA family antidote
MEADMSAKSAIDPLAPVHPGEMLAEEFLKPLGLSAGGAAARMGVPRTRIERLLGRTTRMTPDTALRLEHLLGMPAEFWLSLQSRYDLLTARAVLPASITSIERLEPGA